MLTLAVYFKTSYVEVYHFWRYNSSSCSQISKHLMLKFIQKEYHRQQLHADFKTSYVEVYRTADVKSNIGLLHFKTSYVEVYPLLCRARTDSLGISKHLMLKFIKKKGEEHGKGEQFQNILCWSLSPHFLVTFISFYLFSPSFFLISIIFTKHQPIFFFLSNISQIPRLYNTFSTFFFFSPGKYFYNSQSGMGCSSDVFTTENAWS